MKYSIIVDYIRKEIAQGNIASGAKMPSIRELCSRFNCTKTTAVRAYDKLKELGLIYSAPGSGYYLIEDSPERKQSSAVLDFSGTSLDQATLPYNEFRPCVNQALAKYNESLFSYSDPQGLPSLIEVLRKQLQNHQVFSDTQRIFITTGSQQALNILVRMPFPNQKNNVVIEQPTYHGMIQCLKQNNTPAFGVSSAFRGLDFESLERSFRNDKIKFFYTIPRFNNPLGLSYTNDDKKKILALAEKYNVYIVEDDYLGDLESDAKLTPVFSFDKSDRVVYIKTFSKVLLPGLRVAVVVLPKLLINTFREYKYWADINTPLISQGALEIYIKSGLYNLHIDRIKEMYSERMVYLKELVENSASPSIRWHIPAKGCFYAGLEILNGSTEKAVVAGLSHKGLLLPNAESSYLKEFYNDKILRLSVAHTDISEIESGIPMIINEIESSMMNNRNSIML
ncbi:MAG TPA: PLP-dependent aminotransferase family protein [Clostridia bacterium]|nr:PLP-dependent aminotransferase family protein [Clostridia bacterium]